MCERLRVQYQNTLNSKAKSHLRRSRPQLPHFAFMSQTSTLSFGMLQTFFFVGTFQKKYKKDCLKIIFVGIWKGLLFMQTQCICQLMEMKKMWTSTGEKLSKQQWRGTSDIGLTSEGNMCWSFIFKWKCWYQTRIETRSLLDIVRNVGALLPFIWKKKKSRKKKKAVKGLYGDEKCLWYSDLTGFIGLDLFIYLSFTVVMIIKLAQEVTNHCFHLDLKGFKILWTGSF